MQAVGAKLRDQFGARLADIAVVNNKAGDIGRVLPRKKKLQRFATAADVLLDQHPRKPRLLVADLPLERARFALGCS